MRSLSYENEFCMQFHFHANQSHFHKNGFALRLAFKQRHKETRKWPIATVDSGFVSTMGSKLYEVFSWWTDINIPGGGGYSLIWAIWVCAAPMGMVFQPFSVAINKVSILADFGHFGHE